MEDQMLNILIHYGFSEKEAKIYMVALSLGGGAASSLGRLANLNRSTAYNILQDFARKHIATKTEKKGTTIFRVVQFPQLISKLEDELIQKEKLINQMNTFIPQFANLSLQTKTEVVETYFGIERVKQLYTDINNEAKEIYGFIGADSVDKELEAYLNKVNIASRIKKKIFANILISDSVNNRKYAKLDKKGYKKTKILPINGKGIQGEINLYNDEYIALVAYSTQDMFGTIIKSRQLFDTLKEFFDFFWNLT